MRTFLFIGSMFLAACATTGQNKPPEIPAPIDHETQYRVACHEAGHAVVGAILRPHYPVAAIAVRTAIMDGEPYGTTHHDRVKRLDTVADIVNEAVEDLAGREAEAAVLGQPTDGGTMDLINANKLFFSMCAKSGLCGSLLVEDVPSPGTTKKIERCLGLAEARARALVKANLGTIKELASVLMGKPVTDGKRAMTAEEFRAFLKDRALVRDVADPPGSGTCP